MIEKIKIEMGNIVNYEVDAVINSANIWLLGGSGVCGAIFKAAGKMELQAACDKIGGCATGSAVITEGFNLKAKYIIHAVGPRYSGTFEDCLLLESTYKSILKIARDYNFTSIAIPSISTGVYRYPLDEAVSIALNTIICNEVSNLKEIYIVCFDTETYNSYIKEYERLLNE